MLREVLEATQNNGCNTLIHILISKRYRNTCFYENKIYRFFAHFALNRLYIIWGGIKIASNLPYLLSITQRSYEYR